VPLYWRTSEIKVAWTPRSLIKRAAETTIRSSSPRAGS
jgi:hypothetical protein